MNKSTTEKAYQYIRDGILCGDIPLGSSISEVELSNSISVSRSPVREALRRLESEGLVKLYPGRGTFVIQITSQDIREIFELRLLLESHALMHSYQHISVEKLDDLEERINALHPDNDSPGEFYGLDRLIHETLVNHCGNTRLMKMYERLLLQVALVRRISGSSPQHFSTSKRYHLLLIHAIRRRDLAAATQILTEHLNDVLENTLLVSNYR